MWKNLNKSAIAVAVALMLLLCTIANADSEAQKFEVTFTVTYNAISLEDAAKKEKEFREQFKDACKVDISIKKVTEAGTYRIILDTSGVTPAIPRWFYNN